MHCLNSVTFFLWEIWENAALIYRIWLVAPSPCIKRHAAQL